MNNKKDPKKQTPIIDGDTRPDINLNPEDERKNPKVTAIKDSDKTTFNRQDSNTLEDFKDSKNA